LNYSKKWRFLMARKQTRKFTISVLLTMFCILLISITQVTAHAAPQYGYGRGQGRTDSVNINDYHTSSWDRFSHNYQFSSGADYRFDFGRPTTYSGFVPVDALSVNIRRDANVALQPPSYGVFSGFIPTEPSNRLFPQPVNPNYHQLVELESPNVNSRYDTLQMGVNAEPLGNFESNRSQMNMQNVGTGEFLPPTSIRELP
jgi:hypothetical protein